jgi:HEAT repeat protein
MDNEAYRNILEDSASISLDDLIEVLNADDYEVTTRHLFRLSGLEEPELGTIAKIWKSLNATRRYKLLEDMDDLNHSSTLVNFDEVYALGLADAEANVQEIAIRSLRECEDPKLIRPLLDAMDAPAGNVRKQAADALGNFLLLSELGKVAKARGQEIEDQLQAALKNSDNPEPVRQAALASLGYSSEPKMIGEIEEGFANGRADWTAAAIKAMGRQGDPKWQKTVSNHIDHPDSDIRLAAVIAAGKLEIENVEDQLLLFLDEDNLDIRNAAIWALSELGDKDTRGALQKGLDEATDEEEKERFEEAIDNLSFRLDMIDFNMLEAPPPEDSGSE